MAPAFWLGAEFFLSLITPVGGHQRCEKKSIQIHLEFFSVRETLAQHLRRLFGIFPHWEELLLVPNEFIALEAFVNGFCSSGGKNFRII